MKWRGLARVVRIVCVLLAGPACDAAHAIDRAHTVNSGCFVSGDGVRLCYVAHPLDDAGKPVLVFIPGWTMPAAIWERQIAHFAGKYSLVAFDPRGQGASAAPDFGYTLERRVEDIKELLDRFPGRSFVLVGWSLAVFEVLAYADRYGTARIAGLVLVDNSVGEEPDSPPRVGENPFFVELRTRREATLRDFAAAIFRTEAGSALQETIVASALKTRVEDSILLLSYPEPRAYWRAAVRRAACPVLYAVTPRWAEQAAFLTQNHPRAKAVIFESAGHALFWDESERFNRTLQDFVATLNSE